MSVVSIKAALETALNAMTPSLATAFENTTYVPVSGTPYQICNLMFAQPGNQELGSRHQEIGIFQVRLMYPLLVGTATAMARAELIRTTFKRGYSFASGGITVLVTDTPEISSGMVDGDRFSMPIRIRFISNIN